MYILEDEVKEKCERLVAERLDTAGFRMIRAAERVDHLAIQLAEAQIMALWELDSLDELRTRLEAMPELADKLSGL